MRAILSLLCTFLLLGCVSTSDLSKNVTGAIVIGNQTYQYDLTPVNDNETGELPTIVTPIPETVTLSEILEFPEWYDKKIFNVRGKVKKVQGNTLIFSDDKHNATLKEFKGKIYLDKEVIIKSKIDITRYLYKENKTAVKYLDPVSIEKTCMHKKPHYVIEVNNLMQENGAFTAHNKEKDLKARGAQHLQYSLALAELSDGTAVQITWNSSIPSMEINIENKKIQVDPQLLITNSSFVLTIEKEYSEQCTEFFCDQGELVGSSCVYSYITEVDLSNDTIILTYQNQ